MNLAASDFELFGVPARFAQDVEQLAARWRALQREVHPDRFAAEGAAAQRAAAQWSARVNQAWQRRRDPLARASYLCELGGVRVDADGAAAMPPQFLMQQMALREALDAASTPAALDALAAQAAAQRAQIEGDIASQIDEEGKLSAAAQNVRALMFLRRFEQDLQRRRNAYQLT
ncbi:MAG: Fe-S protein assembly co-chaperone HscB [Ottowia sp.]|nr:Fe-S protein assembly co-chaperone HscB [Ottowia sp.]